MPRSRQYRQADLVTRLLEPATFVPMVARVKSDETLVLHKADRLELPGKHLIPRVLAGSDRVPVHYDQIWHSALDQEHTAREMVRFIAHSTRVGPLRHFL